MANDTEMLAWRGQTVHDASGDKIGQIEEIYLDTETERPEWAQVDVAGLTAGKAFMPLQGVTDQGGRLTAPFAKAQVKGAPQPSVADELSQQDEAASTLTTGSPTSSRAPTAACRAAPPAPTRPGGRRSTASSETTSAVPRPTRR